MQLHCYFITDLGNVQTLLQEISEMLSNNLSMDEEEAVQEELRLLQAEVVSATGALLPLSYLNLFQKEAEGQMPVVLPSVPDTQPDTRVEKAEGELYMYEIYPPKIADALTEPVPAGERSKVAVPA